MEKIGKSIVNKIEITCDCGEHFTVTPKVEPYMIWNYSKSITHKCKCPKCGKRHTPITEYL